MISESLTNAVLCYKLCVREVSVFFASAALARRPASFLSKNGGYMKKFLSIMLTVILVLSMFAAAPLTAFADDVSMNVSVSDAISSSGTVTVTISVSNNSDSNMSNTSATIDGDSLGSMGTIRAGGRATKSYTYKVSDSQRGSRVTVHLDYDEGSSTTSVRLPNSSAESDPTPSASSKPSASASASARPSASASASASAEQGNVKVQKTVKADKTSVPYNSKVNFTFAIENQGDVTISNVRITSSALNSGNSVADSFSLAPGKAKVVTYTGTIVKDIEVSPKLSYTANGRSYEENFGTTLSVKVSSANVTLTVQPASATVQSGQPANFTVTMTNSGSDDLTNLKLFDSANQSVPITATSIPAGQTVTETVSRTITQSGSYSFYLTAQDSSGSSFTFNSNAVTLTVSGATPSATSAYANMLTISVQPSATELKSEGKVTFTIALNNTSQTQFSNVVISESSIGNIDTIAAMGPGETKVTKEVTVSATQEFNFMVSATDVDGQTLTLSAAPVSVVVDNSAGTGSLTTLVIIIIIVIVLIIVVAIILIVFARKDKKRRRREQNNRIDRDADVDKEAALSDRSESKVRVNTSKQKQSGKPKPPKHGGGSSSFEDRNMF